MKDNSKIYLSILIVICLLTLAFHLLIVIKIIPYEITWGGKLKTDSEMVLFETVSIAINAFYLYVLLQKGNYVTAFFDHKTLSLMLWIFFAIFALNTIANLFAETTFEKSFSIITLLNAVLIWLINKKRPNSHSLDG